MSAAPVLDQPLDVSANEGQTVSVGFQFTDLAGSTTVTGPVGIDPSAYSNPADYPSAALDIVAGGDVVVDTDTGTLSIDGSHVADGFLVQRGDHQVRAFIFKSFKLPSIRLMTATGQYPVAILALEDIEISGMVDLRPQIVNATSHSNTRVPGAGGGEGGYWTADPDEDPLETMKGHPAAGAPINSGGEYQTLEGGGGGGHGGHGGDGSIGVSGGRAKGGVAYGHLALDVIQGGSGGGAGREFISSLQTVAEGGDGGGGIEFGALGDVRVTSSGVILVDGADGEVFAAPLSAGGGGAGGGILLHGEDVTVTGVLSANGGKGGNDINGGGGGGGGRILVAELASGDTTVPTISPSAIISVKGGAAGAGGLAGADTPVSETYQYKIVWADGVEQTGQVLNVTPGSATTPAIGQFDGTHIYNDNGTYTVEVTVTDSSSLSHTLTFQVNVANVAPTASLAGGGPVNEGSSGSAAFSAQFDPSSADTDAGFRYAFDFDNDGVWDLGDGSYAGGVTAGSAAVPANYLPNGPATVTVRGRVIDKDGDYTDYETSIDVVNVEPTVAVDANTVTVAEGTVAFNSGSYFDVPADVLSFSASVGDVVNNGDGTWSWSLSTTDGPFESQLVTITADDEQGGVATAAFELIVNNLAPSLGVDVAAVIADEGTVATNSGTFADVAADDVQLSADLGVVTDNGDGTWSWSYNAEDDLAPTTVTITATDKDGASSEVQFSIAVANVAPAAGVYATVIVVDEGSTAGNSGYYSDVASDLVNLSASIGTVIDQGDGAWTWSFDASDGPVESQEVTIAFVDDDGGSSFVTFDLQVLNVNPVIAADADAVAVNEGLEASNSGTFGDVGADEVVLTASVGVVIDLGDGAWSWSYTPADGPGAETVTITATDDDGGVASVNFALNVANVAPSVSVNYAAVDVAEGAIAANSGTFADVASDTVTLSASIGAVVSNDDGTWSWTFNTTDGPVDSQLVTIFAADEDGGASSVTFQLHVLNVAPTIAVDASTVTVNEGSTASNSGVFGDVAADAVTLSSSIGTVVQHDDGTWTWSFDATDGPTQSQPVTIVATDDDGGVSSVTFQLHVVNVAPTITSLFVAGGSACGPLLGQSVTLTGLFSDPGADSHSAIIDWGDGQFTTLTAANMGQLSSGVSHVYNSLGAMPITVTVTDDDGGAASSTLSTFVAGVKLNAGTGVLEIVGTNCNDCVEVLKVNASTMKVVYSLSGSASTFATFSSSAVNKVVMDLRGGDDWGFVSQNITKPTFIFGGDGCDILTGGGGDDVLVGGDGADLLIGRSGNDILIGGAGLDLILGDSGSDIVISGSTGYDNNFTALDAIMAEWSSNRSYAQRVANVTDGVGKSTTRLNGDNYFVEDNVFDDGVIDFLTGGGDRDLFFANDELSWSNDWILDLQNNEFVEHMAEVI